jgi:hypothetical protein
LVKEGLLIYKACPMPTVSSKDLEILELKMDLAHEKATETSEKVSQIKEGLYNPDTGLFSQVKDLKHWSEDHEEKDEEMRQEIRQIAKTANKIQSIEDWKEDHEERDAELREMVMTIAENMGPLTADFKKREGWNKIKSKVLWIVLAAVIAALVPAVKHLVFDAAHDSDRLDNIELMLETQQRQ